MICDKSKLKLSTSNTFSKINEFDLNQSFDMDEVNDLDITCLYFVNKYCENLIKSNFNKFDLNEEELKFSSRYYDSLIRNSLSRNTFSSCIGCISYFLMRDFGSAGVICSKIDTEKIPYELLKFAIKIIVFIVTKNKSYINFQNNVLNEYFKILNAYFNNEISEANIYQLTELFYQNLNKQYSDENLIFIDSLHCVLHTAIEYSSTNLIRKNMIGLNNDIVGKITKNTKLLWEAQKTIIESGVLCGKDVIAPLPTGVGKTKSIEIILKSKLYASDINNIIILAPLKALANEIFYDLKRDFDDDININNISDLFENDETVFELQGKNIFVLTPEKFSYLISLDEDIVSKIDLYVFDESHLFDDKSRGLKYEMLVTKILMEKKEDANIISFSAVLSNPDVISSWMFGNENHVVRNDKIPLTNKSIGFYKKEEHSLVYFKGYKNLDFILKDVIQPVKLKKTGRGKGKLFPKEKDSIEIALYLGIKQCKKAPCAIYCSHISSLLKISRIIYELYERNYDLSNLINPNSISEVRKIYELIKSYYGEDHELSKSAKLGCFGHFSDLPICIKESIEYGIKHDNIRMVACTSTLAEGVNIPIKYLFITSLNQNGTSETIRNTQNLIGRVARSGKYTEGSVIITDPSVLSNQKLSQAYSSLKYKKYNNLLFNQNTEPCESNLNALIKPITLSWNKNHIIVNTIDLANSIIHSYNSDDFYNNFVNSFTVNDANESKAVNARANEIMNVISDLESFICMNLDVENFKGISFLEKSLGFTLATEEERSFLMGIYKVIENNVLSKANVNKVQYFNKTFYDLNKTEIILRWINDYINNVLEEGMDLLDKLIDLFFKVSDIGEIINQRNFRIAIEGWISGDSFEELKNKVNFIKKKRIDALCNKEIAYNFYFLISDILNSVETNFPVRENLLRLQNLIKFGVNYEFEYNFCKEIINDRLLAKKIYEDFLYFYPDEDVPRFEDFAADNKKYLEEVFEHKPRFYSTRLRDYYNYLK